jgi:Putative Flp pilus-assembly TadE/G-like
MLARFLTNNRGGVVPLMAVVAVPLMASVGVAVDYSRINAARTAFQVALDATVLMDIKKCGDGNDAQRQTEATNTFNSLFSRPEVTDITISPNFTSAGGSKLTLNGTAVVHTNFLGIIGVSVSGPLVHEPIIDQRASTEVLRQHQGRRHYALHGAGQHRRRPCLDATAELRQRRREVFPP